MKKYNFKFGQKVLDEMSGFQGKINAIVEWNNGSYQYSVQSITKENGDMGESHFMDHHDLKNYSEEIEKADMREILPKWKLDFDDKVKAVGTPYAGQIIGLAFWSNECARYCVRSNKLYEGITTSQWFDTKELELVKKAVIPKPKPAASKPAHTGGPSSNSMSAKK